MAPAETYATKNEVQRPLRIEVHLKSGHGLLAADKNGKSDPYVVATLGKLKRKSKVVKKTLDPVWNEVLTLEGFDESALQDAQLRLRCYDQDLAVLGVNAMADDLGLLDVPLAPLLTHRSLDYREALSKQGELVFTITRSGGSLDKPPSRKPPMKDHTAVRLLTRLDDKLAAVLHGGAIKLLQADFLRSDSSEAQLPRIVRRQELEAMEARGTRIFLSGKQAVAALRAKKRQIAVLTYGWSSTEEPDAKAAYLAAVRRFLRSPLGTHVTAVFWE